MDKRRMDEPARDPEFIPGIYNYCDQWCERCAFTSRCRNYAMGQEESGSSPPPDMDSETFGDKLHEIFETTLEMIKEEAEDMDLDLDSEEAQEAMERSDRAHRAAEAQPHCRTAMKYIEMVEAWFKSSEGLLEDKSDELQSLAQADIADTDPADDDTGIHDCLEVIRWHQHQIYVKLRRASSGMIHSLMEEIECFQDDANGSAKVAIIGIERSIAAWAALRPHFPDQQPSILKLLTTLKRLLRQVDTSFPLARAFQRPGFDEVV